jgi:class 3 adenylate cyclase/tetratricopeptide (TPR) repeat protein
MKCPRCQQQNPPQAKFCLECATALALRCTNCGTQLPAGAKFCFECATPVSGSGSPPRLASPEAYTPQHLAERILNSKAALEGERKQVTVLFADVKGSMELLADRDPEEARKILDPILERMMEAVHRYEGTVNQVMGDGIMALFGAPLAHEDHAVRACYAALRMQDSIRRYAEEVHRSAGVPLHIRVGVNSGEVVVRSIGSDLRMDYTAVGQTTHLAARMEQMAMAGSTLMTAETWRLAEGLVEVKPLGPVAVKGLGEPVEVYEVVGAGAARSRLQAAAARGLTRFVGRSAELDQLFRALERARGGHGQVVGVVGEPGVGKSRLFWELVQSPRTRDCLVIESGSVSYGKATAYLPVIELLRVYFQVSGRDDARKIREKVSGKLVTLDESLLSAAPAFLALLDVAPDDRAWQGLDPPQRRQRTLDALKRLLLRESQLQPLVLVFEDLHWIDSESQALLDDLIESVPTAQMLLLVNYRPGYEHRWGRKTYYAQIRIDPLQSQNAEELLDSLLGADPRLWTLKEHLIERTEGNPFFLEESVRALVETRALVADGQGYQLTSDVTTLHVAPTVQAVLAARIDRLPSEEKQLLQAAAVIGKDVPFTLLRAISDLPEEALQRDIALLRTAEFLYETTLFPDRNFTFKHALTHDVAYSSLLNERRRDMHARIVGAIETSYPDRLAEHIEQVAQHAFRGEAWAKALIYLRQAGAKAISRCAYRPAIAYLNEALVALQHMPQSDDAIEQAIDVRCDLRNAHMVFGEHERMVEHVHTAEELAVALGDQARLSRVLSYTSANFFIAGEHRRALDSAERGQAAAARLDDFRLESDLNLRLAIVHHALANYPRARELTERNIDALAGHRSYRAFSGPNLTVVLSHAYLVRTLAECGEFDKAVSLGEAAVRIAESVEYLNSLVVALCFLGAAHLRRGDLGVAIPVLEHDVRHCQAADILTVLAWAAPCLGLAYALSGRGSEALPLLEQGLEHGAKVTGDHAWQMGVIGEGYLAVGQVHEASMFAERSLRRSRGAQERGYEAWALRLLGEIAARRAPADVEEADGHYRQALALAEPRGMRPLVAHCHLGLGKLFRKTDKREQAREHVATATTLYREMGMTYWLEKAEVS